MKQLLKRVSTWCLLTFLMLSTDPIFSQTQNSEADALFKTIAECDSLLFEEGFNRCHFAAMLPLIHGELEFLHDQGGRQDSARFVTGFKEAICKGTGPKPIRKLKPGSMQVYPLWDKGKIYGAVQTGEHEFFLAEEGQPMKYTVSALFTHTWILVGDQWKLYRVLSYHHG